MSNNTKMVKKNKKKRAKLMVRKNKKLIGNRNMIVSAKNKTKNNKNVTITKNYKIKIIVTIYRNINGKKSLKTCDHNTIFPLCDDIW